MPNPTLAQPNAPKAPKLLDRVRETMRTSRYSPRTETVYVHWIKRYISPCARGDSGVIALML
jgi:hypothetical protein